MGNWRQIVVLILALGNLNISALRILFSFAIIEYADLQSQVRNIY